MMQSVHFRQQSPGTHSFLSRLLDTESMLQVEEIFAWSLGHGAAAEPGIRRTPGASFNPKPARLLNLLSKEAGLREPTALCAALILLCLPVTSRDLPSPFYAPALELAQKADLLLKQHKLPLESSEVARNIALAWLLDLIRHLHMTTETPDAVMAEVEKIRSTLSTLAGKEPSRLEVLIVAHGERLERQL